MGKKHPGLVMIGKRIRNFREKRGISQDQLAYDLGLDRAYFGKIERGEQNITLKTLFHIIHGLKVKPSVFFKGLGVLDLG